MSLIDLASLNEKQLYAVKHRDGVCQVPAVPGSGKTRVLTTRVAYMIKHHKIPTENILVSTYSREAADEMKKRLLSLVSPNELDNLTIGTLHSVGYRILKNEYRELGDPRAQAFEYGSNLLLSDTAKRWLIENILKDLNIKFHDNSINTKEIIRRIGNHKNNMVDPIGYRLMIAESEDDYKFADVYDEFEGRKMDKNQIDFDDMLSLTWDLLCNHDDILNKYQTKFQYVLSDESQDMNPLMYNLIKLLAEPNNNIFIIGDEDQCLDRTTRVLTNEGLIRIQDIVREKMDVQVLSYNESTKQQEWKRIVNYSETKLGNKKFYEIKVCALATNGRQLIHRLLCTENHKLAIFDNGTLEYLRTDELKVGNYIQVEDSVNMTGTMTKELMEQYKDEIIKLYQTHSANEVAALLNLDRNQVYKVLRSSGHVRKSEETNEILGVYQNLSQKQRINNVSRSSEVRKKISASLKLAHKEGRAKVNFLGSGGWNVTKGLKISNAEQLLFDNIKHLGFEFNLAAKTAGSGVEHVPNHYKIDFARQDIKLGIELDGVTHKKQEQLDKDRKKEICLGNLGWTIVRFKNEDLDNIEEVVRQISSLVNKLECNNSGNCPVLGKIISIEEIPFTKQGAEQKFVYDIEVEGNHNFYAEGILVHNCVYGFNGASPEHFVSFTQDYPQAEVIQLDYNYRSKPEILKFAENLISNNTMRLPKVLRSFFNNQSNNDAVLCELTANEYDEADNVVKHINELIENDAFYEDMAVVYRANMQTRVIEEKFIKNRIPYVIVGGTSFYERREIKDMVAYLRLAVNLNDNDAFVRVLNTPSRFLGKAVLDKIQKIASQRRTSYFYAAYDVMGLNRNQDSNLRKYLNTLSSLNILYNKGYKTERLLAEIGQRTGYYEMLLKEGGEEDSNGMDNVNSLAWAAAEEEKPEAFVKNIMSMIPNKRSASYDAVKLMTLHRSKGQEFKNVFMIGLTEGILPHSRALESENGLEEERRLAYVGMTRAQEKLFISSPLEYGGKSRLSSIFLNEAGLVAKATVTATQ